MAGVAWMFWQSTRFSACLRSIWAGVWPQKTALFCHNIHFTLQEWLDTTNHSLVCFPCWEYSMLGGYKWVVKNQERCGSGYRADCSCWLNCSRNCNLTQECNICTKTVRDNYLNLSIITTTASTGELVNFFKKSALLKYKELDTNAIFTHIYFLSHLATSTQINRIEPSGILMLSQTLVCSPDTQKSSHPLTSNTLQLLYWSHFTPKNRHRGRAELRQHLEQQPSVTPLLSKFKCLCVTATDGQSSTVWE